MISTAYACMQHRYRSVEGDPTPPQHHCCGKVESAAALWRQGIREGLAIRQPHNMDAAANHGGRVPLCLTPQQPRPTVAGRLSKMSSAKIYLGRQGLHGHILRLCGLILYSIRWLNGTYRHAVVPERTARKLQACAIVVVEACNYVYTSNGVRFTQRRAVHRQCTVVLDRVWGLGYTVALDRVWRLGYSVTTETELYLTGCTTRTSTATQKLQELTKHMRHGWTPRRAPPKHAPALRGPGERDKVQHALFQYCENVGPRTLAPVAFSQSP